LIDITVAPVGQQAIQKEYQDVEVVGQTLEKNPHFQALAQSGEQWA